MDQTKKGEELVLKIKHRDYYYWLVQTFWEVVLEVTTTPIKPETDPACIILMFCIAVQLFYFIFNSVLAYVQLLNKLYKMPSQKLGKHDEKKLKRVM